jgi:LTXXQ motif family protein
MSSIKVRRGALALRAQPFVLAALLGAGVLVAPLAALAQSAPSSAPAAKAASVSTHHHASARMMKRETVEQRVAMLHASLKITPAEEAQWTPVAQAMRDNEANMQKLMAETTAKPHPLSAVDDLRTYERFTQAHVGGLKNLISSFETLYQAMPESQKALADQVFRKYGARGATHAS